MRLIEITDQTLFEQPHFAIQLQPLFFLGDGLLMFYILKLHQQAAQKVVLGLCNIVAAPLQGFLLFPSIPNPATIYKSYKNKKR